ncbi:MAG: FHA domain-containing protein [Candidatus Promineifilaceae bacterium]
MKRLWTFLVFALFFCLNSTIFAQSATPQLTVTGVNTAALPAVDVTLAVSDETGQLLNLDSSELVSVKHNGERVSQASVIGSEPAGTFTIILLDLSSGAADRVGDIQSSIQSFASTSFMREQIDHIAIYQINDTNSAELLPPTFFYNDVANLFASGLQPFDGATALFDSMGDLLTRIDDIKPSSELATSLVLLSDGTDAVSSQFVSEEIAPLASSKNIAIHSVIVDTGLSDFSRDLGTEYMRSLASSTGGVSVNFTDASSLNDIWTRVISRGSNTIVRYVIDNLLPGVFDVEISFPNQAQLPVARTQVEVPASIPRVSIDTLEQTYDVTLPLIEGGTGPEPLEIELPVSVIWLDGTERTVAQAQLWHDGNPISEIAPAELAQVATQLPVHYGENRVQVVIRDETGQQSSSAPLLLNVIEGSRDVPSDIGRSGLGIPSNIIWLTVICLIIIALIAALRILWPRLQAAQNQTRRQRQVNINDAPPPVKEMPAEPSKPSRSPYAPPERAVPINQPSSQPTAVPTSFEHDQRTILAPAQPSIEVLESVTPTASLHPLTRSEYLIGRSATVDLPLKEDPTVSRIHATIVQDGDVYRIYDEQSTSGTYVNDREVPEYGLQLSNGDEIHLGAVHLRFRQP